MSQVALRLSVLIPVFNEGRTIRTVIEKVRSQSVPLKEIIVVDDGSTDDTAQIVRQVADEDPLVRFLQNGRNMGKTAAIRRAAS